MPGLSETQLNVQPGAVAGPLIPNGLPPDDILNPDDAGWPKLPGKQAVNFADARPCLVQWSAERGLEPSLYRVWGEPAWDIGRYWSPAIPTNADRFYGGLAVCYNWNSGRYAAALKSPGPLTQIKAWWGTVARQPAMLLSEDGRVIGTLADYHLPGGELQVYIPDGTLPYIADNRTPWNTSAALVAAVAEPSLELLSREHLPESIEPGEYRNLMEALQNLAGLLRQVDGEIPDGAGLRAGKAGVLAAQAGLLMDRAMTVNTGLAGLRSGNLPPGELKAVLYSLVGIGRLVDADFSFSGRSAAVDQELDRIVKAAYALVQCLP
jgi:hypothetical protein